MNYLKENNIARNLVIRSIKVYLHHQNQAERKFELELLKSFKSS